MTADGNAEGGFYGSLATQIQALELISGKPVVAITLNHEDLSDEQLAAAKSSIEHQTELTVCSPLKEGCAALVKVLKPRLEVRRRRRDGQPVPR